MVALAMLQLQSNHRAIGAGGLTAGELLPDGDTATEKPQKLDRRFNDAHLHVR